LRSAPDADGMQFDLMDVMATAAVPTLLAAMVALYM
jgi:hypothetical protein